MKNLKDIITEKLRINKDTSIYSYKPNSFKELRNIIIDRLDESKNADLNDIDVSLITNMESLFYGLDPHNIDISNWNMSNVQSITFMFYNCHFFNCDLSGWQITNNLLFAEGTFLNCHKFKGIGLSNWDMSHVKHMDRMFMGCHNLKKDFDKDIEQWTLNNPTMTNIFYKTLIQKPSWYKQ